MAQRAEQHSASVCPLYLDLPKDLVPFPCGHNYCLKCVQLQLLTFEVGRTNISPALIHIPNQPRSREDFLQYFTDFTMDPNTAMSHLALSDGDRRVTTTDEDQKYPDHQDRFSDWPQVLSRESVTGRCYWEVEWKAKGGVFLAVSYRDIVRNGENNIDESRLGNNDRSWVALCDAADNQTWWIEEDCKISSPIGSRIGVYLDHSAGVLTFYDVAENIKLVHRIVANFTKPLHVGVRFSVYIAGDTVHFPKLK